MKYKWLLLLATCVACLIATESFAGIGRTRKELSLAVKRHKRAVFTIHIDGTKKTYKGVEFDDSGYESSREELLSFELTNEHRSVFVNLITAKFIDVQFKKRDGEWYYQVDIYY